MAENKEPQESENPPEDFSQDIRSQVSNALSEVATNPKKSAAMGITIALVLSYILYRLMFNADDFQPEEKAPVILSKDIVIPGSPGDIADTPIIPNLPEPPKINIPETDLKSIADNSSDQKQTAVVKPPPAAPIISKTSPALPPPPTIAPPTVSQFETHASEEVQQRRKSAIIAYGGAGNAAVAVQPVNNIIKIGDNGYLLSKGKMISAVLETAITNNSTNEIRAVVSQDIFSENGKNKLIPMGSKLIGSLASNGASSADKLGVRWNRLQLPNGYLVNLNAISVDNLGDAGIPGFRDSKSSEKIISAVLLTAFDITLAESIDRLVPPVETNTSTDNQNLADNISQISANIAADNARTDTNKFTDICTQVQAALLAVGSSNTLAASAYGKMVGFCNDVNNQYNTANLLVQVTSVTSDLVTSASNSSSESSGQKAAKAGIENIGKTIRDILAEANNNPVTYVYQGTNFKIFVNQDIIFPSKAISRK